MALKDLSTEQIKELLQAVEQRTLERIPEGLELPTRFEPKEKLLLRFLKSCQGNVEEAATVLSEHVQWREENKVDELALRSPDEIFDGEVSARDVANCMPIIERGEDTEKRPVQYTIASKIDARIASRLTSPKQLFEYQIWLRERALARLDLYGNGSWRSPPYFSAVIDLRGVKLNQATAEFYALIRKIINLDQYHYPGRVGTLVIVNVPFFFQMIWGALRGWLGTSAEKRIAICNKESEAKRTLLSMIEAKLLPSDFGGLAPALPSTRSGSKNEFYCDKVHFDNLTLLAPPFAKNEEEGLTVSNSNQIDAKSTKNTREVEMDEATPYQKAQAISISAMIQESIERSRSKTVATADAGSLPDVTQDDEHVALANVGGRHAMLESFRARIANPLENVETVKSDLIAAIREVEESTAQFERDALLTRARLRRRLLRLRKAKAPEISDTQRSMMLLVGREALQQALEAAQDELDSHSRAVAFARNFIDVDALEWQQKHSTLRARLERVMDENRGLRRTVEVALGRQILEKTLEGFAVNEDT